MDGLRTALWQAEGLVQDKLRTLLRSCKVRFLKWNRAFSKNSMKIYLGHQVVIFLVLTGFHHWNLI